MTLSHASRIVRKSKAPEADQSTKVWADWVADTQRSRYLLMEPLEARLLLSASRTSV